MAAGGLTTQVASSLTDLRTLRKDWDGLHQAVGAATPFSSGAWVTHWWQAFGRSRGWRRDSLHVIVQRDAAGQARAIVPLVLTTLGPGPLGIRKLRPCGSVRQRNLTEIPTPLVWPGFEAEIVDELLRFLGAHTSRFHWCDLLVPAEGALGDRFREQTAGSLAIWRKQITSCVLALPGTWEELQVPLRRTIRESLRHCYNSLAREGLKWTFDVVKDPNRVATAVSDFLRLHRARTRSKKGPRHLDQFPGEEHRAFLLGVMAELVASGAAGIGELRIGGVLAASRVVFTYGDSVYLYYSGFDPRWSRHGVSTLLVAECMKWAIDRGCRSLTFSLGKDVTKTRWGPDPHEFSWLRIPGGAPAGAFVLHFNSR